MYDKLFNYKNLKMFGSKVIFLIDDKQTNKYEAKGEEGIFLGYPTDFDTYFIYLF